MGGSISWSKFIQQLGILSSFVQKKHGTGWMDGWMGGWVDGWVDGSQSRVKDCLQQSKLMQLDLNRIRIDF